VLSCWKKERWVRERIDVFRECCRKAGAECRVAYFTARSADECPMRFQRMLPWAAALPQHCAVFAVNDCCAHCAAKALAIAARTFPRTATLVGADGVEPPLRNRELAATISSVRLDFEFAGYLAAKALSAFSANEGSRKREMKGAACAANEEPHCARNEESDCQFAPKAHPSFRGGAATLHCGAVAPSLPPKAAPPLVFPPLLVDRRKSTRGYGRREPRILEAMEIIRREACEGLTVAELAARFPGTRRLFDMRFREAAGHSALDEILNVRLEQAMELLAHTNLPITSVAHFCGFQTELEFWKIFRKRTGVPPQRFRNDRR
jgi:AraC-like DNA-binding protein